jgi:hypothetical protein
MKFNRFITLVATVGLATLWFLFLVALLFAPGMLDYVWLTFRSLPLAAQIVIGLVTLPVAVALMIWEQPWALWLRLVSFIALASFSIYLSFPRRD